VVARRPRGTEPLEDEARREFAAGGESAEESLVGHGERELLRRLIEALPEELRQPLGAVGDRGDDVARGCDGDGDSRGHGADAGDAGGGRVEAKV